MIFEKNEHPNKQIRVPHPTTGPHRGTDGSAPRTFGGVVRFSITVVGMKARRVGAPSRKVGEERAISRKKVVVRVVGRRRRSSPEIFPPRKACPGGRRFGYGEHGYAWEIFSSATI